MGSMKVWDGTAWQVASQQGPAGVSSVSSVDGRTGVVTLADKYVDVVGDTMTGTLVAPSIGVGIAPVMDGLSVRPTVAGSNSYHTAVLVKPNLTGTWSESVGVQCELQASSGSNLTGLRVKAPTAPAYVVTGVEIEPSSWGTGANYGARIGSASTNTLWLSHDSDTTSAAGGIVLGASRDTNLYRSSANVLRTDGWARAKAFNTGAEVDSDGANLTTFLSAGSHPNVVADGEQRVFFNTATMGATAGGAYSFLSRPTMYASRASLMFGHMRIENCVLATGATVATQYGIYITPLTSAATNIGIQVGVAGTNTLWLGSNADSTTANAGIVFGLSKDVNLYRSAANTLKTDDALAVAYLYLAEAADIAVGTTTGSKFGTSATQKLGFWGTTPVVRNTGWTATAGYTALRTLDPQTDTLFETMRVLGTLIDTLKSYGILA